MAVRELIAIVAHDLRQPASAAMMAADYASEFLDAMSPPEAIRKQLAVIRRSGEHMLRLTGDLLTATTLGAGALPLRLAEVDIVALIEEGTMLLAPTAQAKGVTLAVNRPPSLPAVFGDRDRLLQVLMNIGGNAVKFTPPGGRVTFRSAASGTAVQIVISDTGPGIPPSDIPHIFDPFWCAGRGRAQAGFGLGLAIARGILIRSHCSRAGVHTGDVLRCVGGMGTMMVLETRRGVRVELDRFFACFAEVGPPARASIVRARRPSGIPAIEVERAGDSVARAHGCQRRVIAARSPAGSCAAPSAVIGNVCSSASACAGVTPRSRRHTRT
ncbi:MAG: HAMP domain-containing histidine kinase [Gemmatimonadaceae bacterium]|nr:HAMP domain-containing histidine kinase [Gemmatimonadaceae bacterium]